MTNPTRPPLATRRCDYQPPDWLISHTDLLFELSAADTRVTCRMTLHRQSAGMLVLDGSDLKIESVSVDGIKIPDDRYRQTAEQLSIENLPDSCNLTIVTRINPQANTALEGLYLSSGNFCTQCEAQGFRKITYYLDRPDILSTFSVRIEAELDIYPVLLSNGNLISTELLAGERHRVDWHDPFPKPCYLFALVAGNLAHIEDTYTTASEKVVQLFIYAEEHNIGACQYAMESLKRAMRWDEDVYGLEYDLSRFMIVAVDDFNMGAMENKGLNIFNSKFVLASHETATDTDFLGVESVIAHEYFHNWTGNRVTCRDWFQLSLKEGLTVFRDQEFSADMHSRTLKRIEDVRLLRARQFPEDAGPMAHPVRPDSYIEINNFYTLTVYEKGAEIIRMMRTLLGTEAYRRGIDLYFERHDGQAVTCDDFVAAMQDASGVDLGQFKHWYAIAGTPQLTITDHYDAGTRRYTVTVLQSCPDTPGQTDKPTLHIPLRLGLLSADGRSQVLSIGRTEGGSTVLDITKRKQSFVFEGIAARPVPSFLREFSAPVRLDFQYKDDALAFLMTHDDDVFNRWDAGQRLAQRVIENCVLDPDAVVNPTFLQAFGRCLNDATLEPSLKAETLSLPGIDILADAQSVIDIGALYRARQTVLASIANLYHDALVVCVEDCIRLNDITLTQSAMGRRSLANTALSLLSVLAPERWASLAESYFYAASTMTDQVSALRALCQLRGVIRERCLTEFYTRWQDQRLVVDKWFATQAMACTPQTIDDVVALTHHPAFEQTNPNRLRSLIATFAMSNPVCLHSDDGRGYTLLADFVIALDRLNPQVAARLVSPMSRWRRFTPLHQQLMSAELARILAVGKLSPDVFELVSKSLKIQE